MFSAIVSLDGIISTFDEALVILAVFLLILKLHSSSQARPQGKNADGTRTNGASMPKVEKMDKPHWPMPKAEKMQSMTQSRLTPVKERSFPKFESAVTDKSQWLNDAFSDDVFERLGFIENKPLDGKSDLSTADSGASTADSDSESVDSKNSSKPEQRPPPPWRKTPKTQTNNEIDKKEVPADKIPFLAPIPHNSYSPTKGKVQEKLWTFGMSYNVNIQVQVFLADVWRRMRYPPSHLARQLHQSLTSMDIAFSPDTYQLLVRIAVDAGFLGMATELSLEMERLTGAKLPQDLLDRMLNMHVMTDLCKPETVENPSPDTLKDEMVASLIAHPWSCQVPGHGHLRCTTGLKQKHQIYVGHANKVYCLSIHTVGDLSSLKFDSHELGWNGTTFSWGTGSKTTITLKSTCAEIKEGVVQWAKDNGTGHAWQWTASQ
eukprot:gnl/MRDRNA2_/MRDRNA2_83857_c1_seq15.p1 gnl/MRDRNA2_/MRDRNA2_83857_c1~~gnl/MRDRNA2_/MRDRNA2_83857_c1_seq15.p1  ORF type:complete len:468 (+),score=79.34 gnl/MRDRNA2_/MRDRNA2_83857_c1_seq15:107-1405(+)